jgi:hypothetical protein
MAEREEIIKLNTDLKDLCISKQLTENLNKGNQKNIIKLKKI